MKIYITSNNTWHGHAKKMIMNHLNPNEEVVETNNYNDCDICICSDFPQYWNMTNPKCLHIYLTFENMFNNRFKYTKYLIHLIGIKVICIGTLGPVVTPKTAFYAPWLYDYKWLKSYNNWNKDFDSRYENGAMCMYRYYPNHRNRIANKYKAKRINGRPGWDFKFENLNKYLFDVSCENSKDPYGKYITEKLLQPVMCRNIPIYYGGNLKYTPFNQKRIFYIDNINNLYDIPKDKELLRDIFNMPILNDNADEYAAELDNKVTKLIYDNL